MYTPMGWPAPAVPSASASDRERTDTGLLLLVIGFALIWIPYVAFVADLIVLIGIIFLILGRRAYGPDHHRNVVVGGVLFLITVVAAIGLAIWFAAALVGQLVSNLNSVNVATGALQNDFAVLFIGTAILGVVGAFVRVIMPYALADRTTTILLWAGFALSVAVSVLVLAILYPQIASAITQSTSGTQFNPGPLTSLQTTSTLLGLLNVVPSLLFAWAYYRAREEAIRRQGGPASAPPSARPY